MVLLTQPSPRIAYLLEREAIPQNRPDFYRAGKDRPADKFNPGEIATT